ncbi:Hypothetical predicted protein [Octopus vulgaris]|uniref:Uncharacterized protein n=1 Tax=Octopus vulgaris TaxID=6645 RepID=A0AA36AXR4_OCTVU|nr:Hypothetical predicted protein [Octopus vulgaris]
MIGKVCRGLFTTGDAQTQATAFSSLRQLKEISDVVNEAGKNKFDLSRILTEEIVNYDGNRLLVTYEESYCR